MTSGEDGLRVVIDCLVLGERPSGVERAVAGLLEGIAQEKPRGQRFTAIVVPRAEAELPVSSEIGAVSAPGWTQSRGGRVGYEQVFLPRVAESLGADLLHGAAFVLPLRWRGRSVVTIHDTITLSQPQWCKRLNRLHYGMVMTRSARRADAVVVPSEFARTEVVEQIGVVPERVHVAPLGVGRQFRPAGEDELERVRGAYALPDRYLLCVGNVEPRKNLEGVIAAFERVAKRLPHGLVIAGKRGWRCAGACAAMANSAFADRILWLDWVPHEDIRALYSGADLLVQWSLHEGFGLTPLEAMACGTPAVVSDRGALPEVAGWGGRIVPLETGPEGLSEAFAELLDDSSMLEEMSVRGRRHAAGFTWNAHAQIVASVYREVAGARQ